MGTFTPSGIYLPSTNETGWGDEVNANLERFGEMAFNVNSFGSIQEALTEAAAAGGHIVYLPPGDWDAGDLTFPVLGSGGLYLRGAGVGVTRLHHTGSGFLASFGDGGATDARRTYIEDMTILGTGASAGAVQFNHTRFCGLRRLLIEDFTGAAASVHILGGVHNYFNEIESVQFRDGTAGIRLDGGSGIGANSNYVRYCHFGVHTNAVHIDAGDSNVIAFCEFNGSITIGVLLGGNAVGNKIVLNQFDGPTTGVDVSSSVVTDTMILAAVPFTLNDVGTRTTVLDASQLLMRSGGDQNARIDSSDGNVVVDGSIQAQSHSTFKADVGGNSVVVTVDGVSVPSSILLRLIGGASQSGDLIRFQTSGGANVGGISPLGAVRFVEQADPAAPAADNAVLFSRDNGAGKTQLCARFATGAVQVIATEP